jgi:hypothetical protein
MPQFILLAAAATATAVIHYYRKNYEEIWLVGPLVALSILLIYSHAYDLATVTIVSFPLLAASRRHLIPRVALLVLLAVLFFPVRVWEYVGLGEFSRSREIATAGILIIYFIICNCKWQLIRREGLPQTPRGV